MNFGDPRLPPHFWESCFPEPNTGCWIGLGREVPGGYTQVQIAGKRSVAHRLSYIAAGGELPDWVDDEDDVELDHRCHTPACRNPGHLEPVSHYENCMRGDGAPAENATKVVCKHGHSFEQHGITRIRPTDGRPYRKCLLCERSRNRKKSRVPPAARDMSDLEPRPVSEDLRDACRPGARDR